MTCDQVIQQMLAALEAGDTAGARDLATVALALYEYETTKANVFVADYPEVR